MPDITYNAKAKVDTSLTKLWEKVDKMQKIMHKPITLKAGAEDDGEKKKNNARAMQSIYGKTQNLTDRQEAILKVMGTHQLDNLSTLNKERERMELMLKKDTDRLKTAEDFLALQDAGTKNYKEALALVQAQRMNLTGVNQRLGDIKSRVEGIEDPLAKMFDKTPLKYISEMVTKMKNFNSAFTAIGGKAGFLKNMKGWFKDAGASAGAFSKNVGKIFSGGVAGMFGNLGKVFQILIAGAQGFLASISAIVWPIIAIIAAIYLLKKMWDFNIGGMQTTTFKVLGVMQSAWGKFQAGLVKMLQKLSPIVKLILMPLGGALLMAFTAVDAILQGLFTILEPIFDVIEEIGNALLEPFKDFLPEGAKMGNALGFITKGIGLLAKGIAWLIKVALLPLRPLIFLIKIIFLGIGVVIKALWAILKIVFEGWKKLLEPLKKPMGDILSFIEKWLNPINLIKLAFQLVGTAVKALQTIFQGMKLPGWLQQVIDFFMGKKTATIASGGKEKTSSDVAGASKLKSSTSTPQAQITKSTANNNQKTANVNNTVTIQSSGAIDVKQAPRIGDIITGLLSKKSMF